MRRLLAGLLVVVALVGCASPSATPRVDQAADDGRMGRMGDFGRDEEAVMVFEGKAVSFANQSFSGVILARTTGDPAMYEGDPHAFCVVIPNGVREVSFTLTWPEPRPLLLEFTHMATGEGYETYAPPAGLVTATSPARLTVQDPTLGEWGIWIGWGLDIYRLWQLEIAWASADPAFELEHTHSIKACP